jgi:hypothetical protein
MYDRVVKFLDKFNLISNSQNGFRKNKSTYTAIQTFIGDVQKILDNKQLAFSIFLDLSKAFDVIPRFVACKVGVVWIERNII